MILLSIDVTKLDKNRFKRVTLRNGNEAVYCDLVLFETRTPDTNGNTMIVKQSATKEERAAKTQLPIVGNGKVWNVNRERQLPTPETSGLPTPTETSGVPF